MGLNPGHGDAVVADAAAAVAAVAVAVVDTDVGVGVDVGVVVAGVVVVDGHPRTLVLDINGVHEGHGLEEHTSDTSA